MPSHFINTALELVFIMTSEYKRILLRTGVVNGHSHQPSTEATFYKFTSGSEYNGRQNFHLYNGISELFRTDLCHSIQQPVSRLHIKTSDLS